MRLSTSYRPRRAREGQGEGVTERPIINRRLYRLRHKNGPFSGVGAVPVVITLMRVLVVLVASDVTGPAENFTGNVRIDPLFQASAPARTSGLYVTFEPCARSDRHTHSLG